MPPRTGINKTVVKKVVRAGANRPAAAAKQKKHAQRTPLPAKKAVATETPREKAAAMVTYAEQHGWWAEMKAKADNIVVTCKRVDGNYKEQITAEWNGDRVARGGVLLTIVNTGRVIVLRNVSAARKHIDGSKPVKREVQERRTRSSQPRIRHAISVGKDGKVTIEDEVDDRGYAPVGAHIVDKWYNLKAIKPGRRTKTGKRLTKDEVKVRCGPISKATVEGLTRFFAVDGYTVETEEIKPRGEVK